MRNTFTGYFKGWDRCEDCGAKLHRHGKTGLRHPVKSTGGRTGLQTHHFVLAKKAEAAERDRIHASRQTAELHKWDSWEFINQVSRKNSTLAQSRAWLTMLEGMVNAGLLDWPNNVEQSTLDVGEFRTVLTISVNYPMGFDIAQGVNHAN